MLLENVLKKISKAEWHLKTDFFQPVDGKWQVIRHSKQEEVPLSRNKSPSENKVSAENLKQPAVSPVC